MWIREGTRPGYDHLGWVILVIDPETGEPLFDELYRPIGDEYSDEYDSDNDPSAWQNCLHF